MCSFRMGYRARIQIGPEFGERGENIDAFLAFGDFEISSFLLSRVNSISESKLSLS